VRETLGNIEGATVLFIKPHSDVLAIGRRTSAQVDDDVMDCPSGDPDQLHLFVRRDLPVHPSQGAGSGIPRDTRLYELTGQPPLRRGLGVPGPGEEAALVAAGLWFDDQGAGQGQLSEDHDKSSSNHYDAGSYAIGKG
jgi:hypothetical protein